MELAGITERALGALFNDRDVGKQVTAIAVARRELAETLSATATERLAELPQNSYAERLAIAHAVNRICRDFGLVVIAPRGEYASYLAVDVSEGRSRFRFRPTTDAAQTSPEASVRLVQIRFAVANPSSAFRANSAGLGVER